MGAGRAAARRSCARSRQASAVRISSSGRLRAGCGVSRLAPGIVRIELTLAAQQHVERAGPLRRHPAKGTFAVSELLRPVANLRSRIGIARRRASSTGRVLEREALDQALVLDG